MRRIMKNNAIFALSALLLCLCMLLAACNGGNSGQGATDTQGTQQNTQTSPESQTEQETEPEASTDTETESDSEQVTEPEPEKVTYTVTVIGSDGNPRQGAVVRFYLGEEQVTMVPTGADGVANAELLPDTYAVVIDNILGEKYDTEGCVLSPESPALSVNLYGLPAAGEEIYAYSEAADDYVPYNTSKLSEGEYWTSLTAGDMTYFLFVASRGGVFRLWADEQLPLSIGYFGSTSFVLTESVAVEENNAICVEVFDDMVYNYAFVIGVKAEEASLTDCILHVEYVGQRELTDDDLPWNEVMPQDSLAAFQKPAGTLRPFDVTSTKLSAVYNPEDGYYHLGAVDGPVLMLSLGNDSPYMDALTTVCNNMRLGVYVYDADGKLISKDSYNELIWAYDAVADGGYYPLDQVLADMMITVGNYMGWYDASSPMYLFDMQPLVPENAYLFACVYAQ